MGIIGKIEDKLHIGSHKSSTSHAPTHGEHPTSSNLKGPSSTSAPTTTVPGEGDRTKPLVGLGGPNTTGKDRDHDGIPDKLEGKHGVGSRADRDGDGIPDKLEGRSGTHGVGSRGDRDGDGIPDKLEGHGHHTKAVGGKPGDRDGDGIPDALEGRGHGLGKDRNHDGIPDSQQRGVGRAGDRDGDGIPDALEGGARGTHGVGRRGDRDGDGIPDALEGRAGHESYERLHHAPVVKETVRDEYQHNVQPVIQEEHDRTEVIKTVQPLKDNQVHDTQVHSKQRTDQFREVGMDSRLAAETEEKLRLHRQEVAQQGGRVHVGDRHEFTENAPQVSHTERRHVIEEVQPVVERDVLRPHVVEEKQNIFVHHKEAPELKEVRVAPVLSVQEWERSHASKGERIVGDTALHHQRGAAGDRDGDGIPDALEGRGATHGGLGANRDRDHDGIPDRLEGRGGVTSTTGTGLGRDKNHDGIPDSQQRGGGGGMLGGITEKLGLGGNKDRDHDGIPDKQERGNVGGLGGGRDLNRDGIPDNQQRRPL